MNSTILKALLVSRFEAFKYSLFANARKKRPGGLVKSSKGTMILYSLIFLYAAGCIGAMMFGIFCELAEPYHQMGLDWLYFSMYALMAFGAMFIGTVFTAKTQIYEAKDNDLLLSMPVPTKYILISRLTLLLGMNLLFGLFITVPALLAWLLHGNRDFIQVLVFLLIALLLSFFTLSVTALFGWILSILTRKVRKKAMLSTVCSLVFFGLYFYFVGNMNKLITNLAANSEIIAGKLGAVAPVYWLGSSIGSLDTRHLLYSVLFLVTPFILCCRILSATLIKTITTQHDIAKIAYHERKTEQKSPFSALYRRELSLLLSSTMYLLNCSIGAFMTFAAGIAIIIMKGKVETIFVSAGTIPKDLLTGILVLVVCMVGSMCYINAASVSMEGNKLWFSKSLPVNTRDILKSKLLLQATFAVPSILIASIGIIIAVTPDLVNAIFILIFPQLFAAFVNIMDLSLNLKFPMLDWTNESQPCKTGLAVILAMFLPWGFVLAFGLAGRFMLNIMPVWAILSVYTVILLAASAIFYRRLMNHGASLYDNL